MRQVAAIRKDAGFVDKDMVVFSWMKTCQCTRERVFAAMRAAGAVETGKYKTGDVVTVGYNACSDQVIMAAPGRTRFVDKVALEATDAESALEKLGWKIDWVDVPDDAPGQFQKSPWSWSLEQAAPVTP